MTYDLSALVRGHHKSSWESAPLQLHQNKHCLEIIMKITNKMQLCRLTLILLTWRKWWAPNNASKWQMGFNSAFKELIYYSLSAVHVSGDVFAHHQEHLTVFTASGNIHQCRCRLVSRQQRWWILPDAVNTDKCSWWWAKTSPETCTADKE